MARIFTREDRLWRTALNICRRCIQAVRTDSKPTVVLTVLVVVVHCSVYSPVVRYGFRKATDDVILDTMLDPGNGSAANAAGWIANCPRRAKTPQCMLLGDKKARYARSLALEYADLG